MNRYLLIALLTLLGISTVYGVSTRDGLREVANDARRTISSTPTNASEELSGIESAGQNVIRQTSEEGLRSPRGAVRATGQTVPGTGVVPNDAPSVAEFPEQTLEPVQPVVPAETRPNDQDAIPALW